MVVEVVPVGSVGPRMSARSNWTARTGRPGAADRAEALGQFLDEWEREHGPFTAAELEHAERELGLRMADPAA